MKCISRELSFTGPNRSPSKQFLEGYRSVHGHGNGGGGRDRTTGTRDCDGIGARRGAWIGRWSCAVRPAASDRADQGCDQNQTKLQHPSSPLHRDPNNSSDDMATRGAAGRQQLAADAADVGRGPRARCELRTMRQ